MSPLTVVRRFLYLIVCLAALAGSIARAQEPPPPPAYIAFVEGNVTLERDGEVTPAAINMPLIPGDRVRTTNGRVEIRFPDGTGIELADDSAVELVSPTRVRLLAGVLERLELLPENVNALSTSYLPQDLKMYGATFDQYGSWRYAPDYGYVWYPMVAPDWRPYYYCYWEPVRSYGWTWIGTDVWAWPTHHYGRWGYGRGSWFWVPDRTFAAAWVSWGTAPGYVSWCPLGFDNRPVFALSVGHSDPWRGWTVVSRTHFGSHGYFAHRNAVEPRQLPPQTTFVRQSPPIAVPRHLSNAPAAGAGVAVPRAGNSARAGAFASRPSSITVEPSRPDSIPSSARGQPVRAGTRPASSPRSTTNASSPVVNERPMTFEQRRTVNDQPRLYDQRRTADDQRPAAYHVAVPRAVAPAPVVAAPPAVASSPRPAPSFAIPRATAVPPSPQVAVPRTGSMPAPAAGASQASQPASPPPPAASQRSGSGGGGGQNRAGATAQSHGGDNQSRGNGNGQGGGARRR